MSTDAQPSRRDRNLASLRDRAIPAAAPDRRSRVLAMGEAYPAFAIAEAQRWWLLFEYRPSTGPDARAQEVQTGLLDMLIHAVGDPASTAQRQSVLLLWASAHGLAALACRPGIVAIDPGTARSYLGDLVDTGLKSVPSA